MKKSIMFMAVLCISLLATVATSCDKDDSDDIPEKGKVYISFNTGSLYKELGITDTMAQSLYPTGKYMIFDSVLVYNQTGALVTKLGMESNTLEKKQLELKDIPEGTYTLVLWQSAYRPSDGLKAWTVKDEESLSTVSIDMPSSTFRYGWALGYTTATVTLGDKSVEVEMTPKALGNIIDVTIDNYTEDLGYTRIAMVGGYAYIGVYLDPSRQEDRWIPYGNYASVPFRITPEDEGKGLFFTFLLGEDLGLSLRGDRDNDFDELSYCQHKTLITGGNYVVYLDIARRDWQPTFVGPTEDFSAWKADRDAGLLVIDPYLGWGSSLTEIQKNMERKQWWVDGGKFVDDNKTMWSEVYWVSKCLYERYIFNSESTDNLISVCCGCIDKAVPFEMADLLVRKQGYIYTGKIKFPDETDTYEIYFSEDKKTEVMTFYNDGDWMISYQPTDPNDLQYILP